MHYIAVLSVLKNQRPCLHFAFVLFLPLHQSFQLLMYISFVIVIVALQKKMVSYLNRKNHPQRFFLIMRNAKMSSDK